ncbi:MAG: hypothetical protein ABI995_05890 [Acidobacteriota bacterium]
MNHTILASLLASALVTPAGAAVVPRMAFEQMVDQSARIVHGRVLDSSVGSSGQFLWTHYRVQVLDQLKGGVAGEIIVSEPGGTLNGVTQQLSGTVDFRAGEEVVLFLYQTPIGCWRTNGYWQGKFEVEQTATGKRVRTDVASASIVNPMGRAATGRALDSFSGMDLEAFKTAIRRQAAR